MQFPSLALDLPDYTDGSPTHLTAAKNVYPATVGYKPFKGLVAATGDLGASWVGGGAFEYNGTAIMVGATAAALFSHSGSSWTSQYVVATTQPWHFVQFGDLIVGTNGGSPVKYTISTGAAAALGGSPPSARYPAVVRDFLFLAGDGSAAQTVSWSAINDAEGWTEGTNQSDEQQIPDGGPITGLAGGEYGLVFQREQVSIFEYVGVPFIFTRRTLTREVGALCHGSIGQYGRTTFFLSRRGFYALIDGQLLPIGKDAVDRAFLDSYTTSELETSLRCAVDPERYLTIWSMPGKLWICYWGDGFDKLKWSTVEIADLVGIAPGITASVTLEEIAVTYPSIEDATPNFDDAFWRGGVPLLLLFKTDNIGYTFTSGDNLEATIRLCKLEPVAGRTSHIRLTRPITDAVDGITVSIDASFRQGDTATSTISADLRTSGDIPIRATGQYIQYQQVIAAGTAWTYASGVDIEGSPGGRL
jgi:hypothetical protein